QPQQPRAFGDHQVARPAARTVAEREVALVRIPVEDVAALRMERRLHLLADQPGNLRELIQPFDLLDQAEQDLFLIVSFAEEAAINPGAQALAERQAQRGGRDQGQRQWVLKENLADGAVGVGDYGISQAEEGERQDEAQRIAREQVLQTATHDDIDVEDAML